jgi:RNA polymerase primary sigma factor
MHASTDKTYISYAFRCKQWEQYMLTLGINEYPDKPQICVYSKREISPAFIDEYCILVAKNINEQPRFTKFGEEVFSSKRIVENNFVAKIDDQIEFVKSKEVIESLNPLVSPSVSPDYSLNFFEEETSGFIILLRIYRIDKTIEDDFLSKGRRGPATIIKLYDEDDIEVSVNVTLGKPLLNQSKFENIKDEIIHKLRSKGALLGVYPNNEKGKSQLQQLGDIRRSYFTYNRTLDFSGNEDRAKKSYDPLYETLMEKYPNMQFMIGYIMQIKPAQFGEIPSLYTSAMSGDTNAYNRLIEVHLRSILRIAYRTSLRYNVDFEDAFQDGVSGFIQSLSRYDDGENSSISAYAGFWIRQSIQRNSVQVSNHVYVPVHLMEGIIKIKNIVETHLCPECNEKTVCPSLVTIVNEIIGCDDEQSKLLINMFLPVYAFSDIDMHSKDHSNLVSQEKCLADISDYGECINSIEERVDREITKGFVDQLLGQLHEKQRDVMELRFGINYDTSLTLEEVGEIIGVTRERIRQVQNRATQRLRKYLNIEEQIFDE